MYRISDSDVQGSWEPIKAGWHTAAIEEAGWVTARTGATQLKVKASVGGRFFSDWITVTKASGEPVGIGRSKVSGLAKACGAVTANGEPDPKGMAGRRVKLCLSIEEDGRGVPRNRIREVEVPTVRGDPGVDAAAYREASGGRVAPRGGGGNTEGPDPDDAIPFIRMDGLPW